MKFYHHQYTLQKKIDSVIWELDTTFLEYALSFGSMTISQFNRAWSKKLMNWNEVIIIHFAQNMYSCIGNFRLFFFARNEIYQSFSDGIVRNKAIKGLKSQYTNFSLKEREKANKGCTKVREIVGNLTKWKCTIWFSKGRTLIEIVIVKFFRCFQ